MFSKSAQYCHGFGGGSNKSHKGLLLLSEVAVGDMHEMNDGDFEAPEKAAKAGKNSVKGVGRQYIEEKNWNVVGEKGDLKAVAGNAKNSSGGVLKAPIGPATEKNDSDEEDSDDFPALEFNEYIIYDEGRVRPKLLVQVEFEG